jgi:tetratricopeptide (TPR) repeat protein
MNSKEKTLLSRGIDKVRQKKYDEALEIFERLLASNQDIPEVWNNRGVALFGLGRIDQSLESYERCLAIDPENLDALRNKGFLLRNQKRLEEALSVYDTVLQKGGDAYDMEATAAVLAGMGRLGEALSCLYLARDEMPLQRLEEEIEMIKNLMDERGIPIPERIPVQEQPGAAIQGKE